MWKNTLPLQLFVDNGGVLDAWCYIRLVVLGIGQNGGTPPLSFCSQRKGGIRLVCATDNIVGPPLSARILEPMREYRDNPLHMCSQWGVPQLVRRIGEVMAPNTQGAIIIRPIAQHKLGNAAAPLWQDPDS